jgi:hypothetical protein
MEMKHTSSAAGKPAMAAETGSRDPGRPIRPYWLLLLLSMSAAAGIAVLLGQDVNWDVFNYHFYSGFAFLHKPLNYDFAPAQVQSFFNPLIHVLSYLMLAHLPSKLVAALLGAVQGLNFYLVFQISSFLFQSWRAPFRFLISLGNAAAGFYGAINMLELGTTFGDNLGSILVLVGLLLIFRYLKSSGSPIPGPIMQLGIAGASLGVAMGLKLTVAIYVISIVFSLAVLLIAWEGRIRPLAVLCGGWVIGFIAAYGIWGISLYRAYRNPVFPHLNAIFRSPYYDLRNISDARFLPQTWRETLFYPFLFASKNHLVSEIDFRDVRLACCYVALILLAGVGLYRLISRGRNVLDRDVSRRCLLFLASVFAISYAVWQHLFSIYRYLIILEFLAPTLLALILAYFFRRKSLVLASSLLLNAFICAQVVPADYGRRAFDDAFLKRTIPSIANLDKSVVLMGGSEATSYIVPQFPATTRFVRVASNFVFPGRNANLDLKIRGLLAQYDASRTLVYLANREESDDVRRNVAYYGVILDDRSCVEVRSNVGNSGYLCGVLHGSKPGDVKLPPLSKSGWPDRLKATGVRLNASLAEVRAGYDSIEYQVSGMKVMAADMLYTIDGRLMTPVTDWHLDFQQHVHLFVGASSQKGLYHVIGIRETNPVNPNKWIEVDATVIVK